MLGGAFCELAEGLLVFLANLVEFLAEGDLGLSTLLARAGPLGGMLAEPLKRLVTFAPGLFAFGLKDFEGGVRAGQLLNPPILLGSPLGSLQDLATQIVTFGSQSRLGLSTLIEGARELGGAFLKLAKGLVSLGRDGLNLVS